MSGRRLWFFPSWCGDFRLTGDGAEGTLLTVTDPTPVEQEQLHWLIGTCIAQGFAVDGLVAPSGASEVRIGRSVDIVGGILAGVTLTRGSLTVNRDESGKVVWAESLKAKDGELVAAPATAVEPSPAASVTVKRPTSCCPDNAMGEVDQLASEVLEAFSTARQWSDWNEHGYLYAIGGRTDHLYQIVHRRHELAEKRTKILYDCTDDGVLHCWDWSVPPAEEVLAMKLFVEHAEQRIRTPNTCLGFGGVGPNFQGFSDKFPEEEGHRSLYGTWDAGVLQGFGALAALAEG